MDRFFFFSTHRGERRARLGILVFDSTRGGWWCSVRRKCSGASLRDGCASFNCSGHMSDRAHAPDIQTLSGTPVRHTHNQQHTKGFSSTSCSPPCVYLSYFQTSSLLLKQSMSPSRSLVCPSTFFGSICIPTKHVATTLSRGASQIQHVELGFAL